MDKIYLKKYREIALENDNIYLITPFSMACGLWTVEHI